jgi:hypothetical protein
LPSDSQWHLGEFNLIFKIMLWRHDAGILVGLTLKLNALCSVWKNLPNNVLNFLLPLLGISIKFSYGNLIFITVTQTLDHAVQARWPGGQLRIERYLHTYFIVNTTCLCMYILSISVNTNLAGKLHINKFKPIRWIEIRHRRFTC